jgi:hypothetical protein
VGLTIPQFLRGVLLGWVQDVCFRVGAHNVVQEGRMLQLQNCISQHLYFALVSRTDPAFNCIYLSDVKVVLLHLSLREELVHRDLLVSYFDYLALEFRCHMRHFLGLLGCGRLVGLCVLLLSECEASEKATSCQHTPDHNEYKDLRVRVG